MKTKTQESNYAVGTEYAQWDDNRENGYSFGLCFTKQGFIKLYYQPIKRNWDFCAWAIVIHKGRIRQLITEDEVTRLGWLRIAKKWARKIR